MARSKKTAAPWAAGRSSQAPDQGQIRLEGDVGEVVDRAVGVALRDVVGEVVVERLAVGDPVGADHARVADVDRARVGHVEPDPEADQEEGRDQQPGRRPDRAQPLAPPAQRRSTAPGRAGRASGGYCERHRDADLGPVEEEVGDAEAEQDQQVEVGDPPGPPPVDQPEQEERAEGQEDVGRVELVAEGARVAARHLPGDLVAGPRLAHLAAARVDDDQRHLLVAGEVADLPVARRPSIGAVGQARRSRRRCSTTFASRSATRDRLVTLRSDSPRRRGGRRRDQERGEQRSRVAAS